MQHQIIVLRTDIEYSAKPSDLIRLRIVPDQNLE
jgi:hypothetical protein